MKRQPELETVVLIVTIVLIVIVLSAYIINFFNSSISKETIEWAQFGDYLGGTTTPVLSFVTLLFVLINYKRAKETNIAIDIEKSVRLYFELAVRIEEKIDEKYRSVQMHLPPFNNIPARNNPKERGTHPAIWELCDLFLQLVPFVRKIATIDSKSPILGYYNDKYTDLIGKIVDLGYADRANLQFV